MKDDEIESLLQEMGADLGVRPPREPRDVDMHQMAERWECSYNSARERANKLAKSGKWTMLMVRDGGRDIWVIRKSANGKTKR